MTLPRPVYPGTAYMVTRNCTQRMFLLRPDAETNNAVIYCLAVAAQRYEIDVLNFIAMSNHLHDDIYDRHGNAPAFYEHFHKLLAKCMNVIRGRWENFFSSHKTHVLRLVDRESLIRRLVYVAINPVQDDLVAKADEWPGATGTRALLDGTPLRATRPKQFFAADGNMPETVELRLVIPPALGDHDEIVAEVRRRILEFEVRQARKRTSTGRKVLGRYALLRQSWREKPTTYQTRRGLRPMIAAHLLEQRVEEIRGLREFVREHRSARAGFVSGRPVVFPWGTYWMRRFMGVEVCAPKKQS